MQVPVAELVAEFVRVVRVPDGNHDEDALVAAACHSFESSPARAKRDMRRLMEKDADAFFCSACRMLRDGSETPAAACMMELLWLSPALIRTLANPALMPLNAAISIATRWVEWEPLLDIKLLRLVVASSEWTETCDLVARRVLALVGALPANRRILLPLQNLLRSPDASVRSKAVRLFGRASMDPAWVRKRLDEPDARLRANAVESLWGNDSVSAMAVLREAADDSNHRVAANALIGLHENGEDITARLESMAGAADPLMRAAAAFAVGYIEDINFKTLLTTFLKDDNAQVRRQALRSLIKIQRQPSEARPAEVAEAAPPGGASDTAAVTHPA
jgi:HEAT repeat protein